MEAEDPDFVPSPVARGTGMLRAGGRGLHQPSAPRGGGVPGVPIITPGSPRSRGRGLLRVAGAGTRSPHQAAPNPSDQGQSSDDDDQDLNLNLNVVPGSGLCAGVVHAVGDKEDRAVDFENMDVDVNEFLQSTKNRNTKSGETQFIRHFNDTFDALNKQKKAGEEPYKHFDDCSSSNVLANQMCKFLILCRKKDGGLYNASSLRQFYTVMSRILRERPENPINIHNDPEFERVALVLKAQELKMAAVGKNPGSKAAKPIDPDVLSSVYAAGAMGTKTPRALLTHVWYMLTSNAGLRSTFECYCVHNEDVIPGPPDPDGVYQYYEILENRSKTRRGGPNQKREMEAKVFRDESNQDVCPVKAIMKYQQRKTKEQLHPQKPFFLTIKQSAQARPDKEDFWYTTMRMGEGEIGKLLQKAFIAANIDPKPLGITSYSSRKTLAQSLADANCDGTMATKNLGHRYSDTKLKYQHGTRIGHEAVSKAALRTMLGRPNNDYNDIYKDVSKKMKSTCQRNFSNDIGGGGGGSSALDSDDSGQDGNAVGLLQSPVEVAVVQPQSVQHLQQPSSGPVTNGSVVPPSHAGMSSTTSGPLATALPHTTAPVMGAPPAPPVQPQPPMYQYHPPPYYAPPPPYYAPPPPPYYAPPPYYGLPPHPHYGHPPLHAPPPYYTTPHYAPPPHHLPPSDQASSIHNTVATHQAKPPTHSTLNRGQVSPPRALHHTRSPQRQESPPRALHYTSSPQRHDQNPPDTADAMVGARTGGWKEEKSRPHLVERDTGTGTKNRATAAEGRHSRSPTATATDVKSAEDPDDFESLSCQLATMGLQIRRMPPDGNCLFRSLADGLVGNPHDHLRYRTEVVNYMRDHSEEFSNFICDGDDETFDNLLFDMAGPDQTPPFVIHGGEGGQPGPHEIHVAFRNRNHYDSIRKWGDVSTSAANLRLRINPDVGLLEPWSQDPRSQAMNTESVSSERLQVGNNDDMPPPSPVSAPENDELISSLHNYIPHEEKDNPPPSFCPAPLMLQKPALTPELMDRRTLASAAVSTAVAAPVSSTAPSTDDLEPFKCGDCRVSFSDKIYFKMHLRSKIHIMKLECIGKLPIGMYEEMERVGTNLNEIDGTDCENSLESLQQIAVKLRLPKPLPPPMVSSSSDPVISNHEAEATPATVRSNIQGRVQEEMSGADTAESVIQDVIPNPGLTEDGVIVDEAQSIVSVLEATMQDIRKTISLFNQPGVAMCGYECSHIEFDSGQCLNVDVSYTLYSVTKAIEHAVVASTSRRLEDVIRAADSGKTAIASMLPTVKCGATTGSGDQWATVLQECHKIAEQYLELLRFLTNIIADTDRRRTLNTLSRKLSQNISKLKPRVLNLKSIKSRNISKDSEGFKSTKGGSKQSSKERINVAYYTQNS